MSIRSAHKSDWSSIKDIYQLGIDSKNATFETAPPDSYEEWFSKFDKNNVFVHEVDKKINGWITLSHYSSRCCYEGVGEVSIYVHPDAQREGVATKLYNHLEKSASDGGYWTIQAQLFTENIPSKKLFKSLGFREVGVRKKIGQLDGKWIDNYLFEKNIGD